MNMNFEDEKIKALIISGVVFCSFFTVIGIYFVGKPLLSTSYYHANIQFRAGNEESYHDITTQSLVHIVEMYDRHPNWIWTLECQGLLIEFVYEEYPELFEKMQKQNQRGQMELISPQYSHGLAVAYNYKDFADSIKYNKYLLESIYNFTISDVIVLQEGQFLPAFPLLKGLGFTTAAISRDQLSYFNYFPDKPLMEYSYFGDSDPQPAYVMPLIWLPIVETGVLHHQLALSDSERINTGGIQGPHEFNFNPDKMREIELRHIELEKRGNIWMNMSDWVKYNVQKGNVGKMDRFLPENHWTPNRHYGTFRWMGWSNGESDDGIVHSRNYYTRNRIQAAEILLENAFTQGFITESFYTANKTLLLNASKHLWLAQVTDTSGVNPNEVEFAYAINNTFAAQTIANGVIQSIWNSVDSWKGNIQVDARNRRILNETSQFLNITFVENATKAQLESLFGFQLDIQSKPSGGESINCANYTMQIKQEAIEFRVKINGTDTDKRFNITRLVLEFPGRRGVLVNQTQDFSSIGVFNNSAACNGLKKTNEIGFIDNWTEAVYSPSLDENRTVQIKRSDFLHPKMIGNKDYQMHLPLSNGLLYNPDKEYAIIKNNSVRHISVRWNQLGTEMRFLETEVQFNSRFELILFSGSLQDSLLLANIINPYPFIQLEAI